VVSFNRCHLGKSSDICVNIIQNPLGAMSRCAGFHLDLFFDDAMFTKIQLVGIGTFQ